MVEKTLKNHDGPWQKPKKKKYWIELKIKKQGKKKLYLCIWVAAYEKTLVYYVYMGTCASPDCKAKFGF